MEIRRAKPENSKITTSNSQKPPGRGFSLLRRGDSQSLKTRWQSAQSSFKARFTFSRNRRAVPNVASRKQLNHYSNPDPECSRLKRPRSSTFLRRPWTSAASLHDAKARDIRSGRAQTMRGTEPPPIPWDPALGEAARQAARDWGKVGRSSMGSNDARNAAGWVTHDRESGISISMENCRLSSDERARRTSVVRRGMRHAFSQQHIRTMTGLMVSSQTRPRMYLPSSSQ